MGHQVLLAGVWWKVGNQVGHWRSYPFQCHRYSLQERQSDLPDEVHPSPLASLKILLLGICQSLLSPSEYCSHHCLNTNGRDSFSFGHRGYTFTCLNIYSPDHRSGLGAILCHMSILSASETESFLHKFFSTVSTGSINVHGYWSHCRGGTGVSGCWQGCCSISMCRGIGV
jgi:hypothetical protein